MDDLFKDSTSYTDTSELSSKKQRVIIHSSLATQKHTINLRTNTSSQLTNDRILVCQSAISRKLESMEGDDRVYLSF